MSAAVPYQLAAAGLLLLLMGIAALALMRSERRRTRFSARIEQFALPYARATAGDPHEQQRSATATGGTQTIFKSIARLLAFDVSHQERYFVPWWFVLPTGLLLARGIVAFAQILFGATTLLAFPVVWILTVRQFYCWCEKRRLRTLYEQFPDALAMLVRAVRVGIPITEGIRNVAAESPSPTGPEFGIVVDQLAIGVTLEEALHELAARNQVSEYRFFATALALQSETGGAVSETLERLADVIRRRVALREHARALASEARTSIAILAALPVFSGGALALLSPDYVGTLFTEDQGRRILMMAIISLACGVATMQTIVTRSLS